MRLYQLALVPVLTAGMLTTAACKEEDATHSKATIWTYEMSGGLSNGKQKITARYTYGSRAARMSSTSGKVSTKPKTAGPKTASINVGASNGGAVWCKIVVKKGGAKVATITNSGSGSHGATCTFRP